MKFKKAIPLVVSLMMTSIVIPVLSSCGANEVKKETATIKVSSKSGTVKLFCDGNELKDDKVEVGKTVNIQVTPNKDYVVKSVLVNSKEISKTASGEFKVEVAGTYEIEVLYEKVNSTSKVIIEESINGKVEAKNKDLDLNKVLEGTVVELNATPNDGYELESLLVNDVDATNELKFTCESGVSEYLIKATFKLIGTKPDPEPEPTEKANILISTTGNGTVEILNEGLDINDVPLNTEIKLNVTVVEGYILESLTVNDQDISESKSFVVTETITYNINAIFKKLEVEEKLATIEVSGIGGGSGGLEAAPENFIGTNIKVTEVNFEACYNENGQIKLSSSKKSGNITLKFDKVYKVKKVKVYGSAYGKDTPTMTVKAGNQSANAKVIDVTEVELGELVETGFINLSSPKKQRFMFNKIELVIVGEGGTVDPTPDPDPNPDPEPTKKEATLKANKTGNGQVTLEKNSGFEGDIVKATIIPDANSYIRTIEFNGEYKSLDSSKDYVSLTLKAGENILNVVFAEKGAAGGDSNYDNLYANDRIKPTRGSQGSYDSYYEPVRGLKGPALKEGLNKIIKGHKTFSYSSLNTSMKVTDEDPFNPSNMIFAYEGSLSKSTAFNKEHTWAKSIGDFGTASGPGTDMHHLRPSNQNLNSTRSNFDFAEVPGGKDCGTSYDWSRPTMKGNLVGGGKFEPKDEFKGDVARMIFYMATRYEGDDGYCDLEVGSTKNKIDGIDTNKFYTFGQGKGAHGEFNDLYKWATSGQDPVSDIEVNRNNIIDEKYQHNRNPFIDHPEFIIMIYDKTYSGAGALNDK